MILTSYKRRVDFLCVQVIYDFEKETLQKISRMKSFKKLRETRFKDIFKKSISSISS